MTAELFQGPGNAGLAVDRGDIAVPDIPLQRLPGATLRPHVCFVAPEAWPVISGDESIEVIGGAEVQQCTLAGLLAQSGYRVSMICFDYGQPARVSRNGVEIFRAHKLSAGLPVVRYIYPRLTAMWQTMRQVDADIYYQRSTSMLTAVVATFCRAYSKRSVYAGASDSDFVPGQQMIRYARDRWLFERGLAATTAIVVQNEVQQRDCLVHYGRDSTLIPSCYKLPTSARPGGGDYVLWVATLRPGKRPELLLELARLMPQRRFVMVGGAARNDPGGSAYFETIRTAAAALGNVEFLGFLPLSKVEPYFDRARIVINTSVFEGMPNVFLQAWARGIPTVAFIDIGARLHNKPVYRVAADVNHAAEEIERLFTDDIHRAHAVSRCRDYFNTTHGGDEVLSRYKYLLDDLMRGVDP